MSASSVLGPTGEFRPPIPARLPPVDFAKEKALADSEHLVLLEADGIPMDSYWHSCCINLLIEQVHFHAGDRSDYFVGGDMFVYFSVVQARNLDFRGPDFFYVSNTTREPARKYWVVWEENQTPDVVIELASESTRQEDYGAKFAIYRDRLRVGNYFIYDPETRVLDGWQLRGSDYVPIPRQPNGRLWSDKLGLHLGEWHGEHAGYIMTWLRWLQPTRRSFPNSRRRRNTKRNWNETGPTPKSSGPTSKSSGPMPKSNGPTSKSSGPTPRSSGPTPRPLRLPA